MQEALTTTLLFLKSTYKLTQIETFSATENSGSRSALEKVGFQPIQYLTAHTRFPNWNSQMQDCIKYRLDFI